VTFSYLDLYEKQIKEERQAKEHFNKLAEKEQKEAEENKPAFFRDERKVNKDWREDEYEAWKKLQKQTEMNFDPDTKTPDELREFFRLNKEGGNALEDMSAKMFESLNSRLKFRQINFYAFMNKEFNIMNYKSARCSMHCFDDTNRPLLDVNKCLQVCRSGIRECHEFAHKMQKEAEQDVHSCVQEAEKQDNLTDPVVHWISCYERLVVRFDNMEE